MKINISKITHYFSFIMLLVLAACAATNSMPENEHIRHSFDLIKGEFDGMAGVERVTIIDYIYGNPDGYAVRNPDQFKNRGECEQGVREYLNMPRKDLKIFYIKWRDNQTGEIREVTLDLKKVLPKGFDKDHSVFASFKSGQFYAYVVTPERRPADWPPDGPIAYQWRKTIQIYPENNRAAP